MTYCGRNEIQQVALNLTLRLHLGLSTSFTTTVFVSLRLAPSTSRLVVLALCSYDSPKHNNGDMGNKRLEGQQQNGGGVQAA